MNDLKLAQLLSLQTHLNNFSESSGISGFLSQSKTFMLVVDSGASATSTPNKDDFVPGTYRSLNDVSMKGFTKSLPVIGEGEVEYQLVTDDGSKVTQ